MELSLRGKVLSTLLAITLVTGLSPMTAFALEESLAAGFAPVLQDASLLADSIEGDATDSGQGVRSESAETLDFSSYCYAQPSIDRFGVGDVPDDFKIYVYPFDDEGYINWDVRLIEGTDYSVIGYKLLDEATGAWGSTLDIDLNDAEAGTYCGVLQGMESYQGEALSSSFRILASNDLALAEIKLDNQYVYGDGVLQELPLVVTLGKESLAEGEHYTVTITDEGGNEVTLEEGLPRGYYTVGIDAIENSGYTGYGAVGFRVYDAYDLSNASLQMDTYDYYFTGSPVQINAAVTDALGNPLEAGTDYKYVFYDDGYNLMNETPTEAGSYGVGLAGVENSKYYTDNSSYSIWWFTIIDKYDLGNCSISIDPWWFYAGQMPEDFSVEVSSGYEYNEFEPDVLVEGVDYTVRYQMLDESISVHEEGDGQGEGEGQQAENWIDVENFDGSAVGTYRVVVEGIEGGASLYHGIGYAEFRVIDYNDLLGAEVQLEYNQYVYGDSTITAPPVTVTLDDETLIEGTHYVATIYDEGGNEYTFEDQLSRGWYGVKIIAVEGGGYTGSTSSNFYIYDAYNLNQANWYLDRWSYRYTGESVQIEATVRDAFGEELVEGVDYQFIFRDSDGNNLDKAPEEVGNYSVSIGDVDGSDYYYDGGSWNEFSIVDINDLGVCDVGAYPNSFIAGKLPSDFTIIVYPYVENEYDENPPLKEGEDYTFEGYERLINPDENVWETVDLSESVPAGIYRGVLAGEGDYHGTAYAEFRAYAENDLSWAEVEVLDRYVYGKNTATPQVTVRFNGVKLQEDVDYTLFITDERGRTHASDESLPRGYYGAAIAAVPGGSYVGEIENWFNIIDAYDLSYAESNLNESVFLFTGEPIQPDFTVKDALGKSLEMGVDYECAYMDDEGSDLSSAPSEVGQYSVTIKAKNGSNYFGQVYNWRSIEVVLANDLVNGDFSLNKHRYAFTGEPVVLDVECARAADGTDLVLGTDYSFVFYSEDDDYETPLTGAPSEPGDYQVVFKGEGNYTGESDSYDFYIYDPYDLSDDDYFDSYAESFFVGKMPSDFGVNVCSYRDDYDLKAGEDFASAIERSDGAGEWVLDESFNGTTVGKYRFVVTGNGSYHGTRYAYFNVMDPKDLANAESDYPDWAAYYVFGNGTVTPVWNLVLDGVTLSENTHYSVTYYEDYDEEEGEGTAVGSALSAGEYYAVFTAVEGGGYIGTRGQWVVVYDASDLSEASFRLSQSRYAATGEPVQLAIEYAYALGGTELVEGVDYEICYVDDDGNELSGAPSEVGDYRVYLKAKEGGPYRDQTYSRWFEIINPIDLSNGDFSLEQSKYAYTGKAVELKLDYALTFDGTRLNLGTDFEFYYEDEDGNELQSAPIEIGDYCVGIRALSTGSYVGETRAWEDFSIVAANDLTLASVDLENSIYIYTGDAITPVPTVMMGGEKLTVGTDFSVTYERYDGYEDEWNEIEFPTEVGEYSLVVTGIGDYIGSESCYFNILESNDLKAATITGVEDEYAYTGHAIAPRPTVVDAFGNELTEGTHFRYRYFTSDDWDEYSISPDECVEVGRYAVVVEAIKGGGYIGSQWLHYDIVASEIDEPTSISGATVAAANQVYSGRALTPEVTVTLNGATIPASGYTVAYSNNVNAGTATVTVTGQGDYKGVVTGSFTIAPMDVDITIVGKSSTVPYDGSEHAVTGFDVVIPSESGLSENDIVFDGVAEVKGTEIGTYNMGLVADEFSLAADKVGNYNPSFSLTDGYLTIYDDETDTPIDVPAAAAGLVYSGSEQIGVANGEHYAVQGGSATNAGSYTATLTADDGFVFPSGQTAIVAWSIAPKPASVTALDSGKAYGQEDPELSADVEGLVDGDDASAINYTLKRSDGEGVGEYAITASGADVQGNYAVTYKPGTFTIAKAVVSIPVAVEGLVGNGQEQVGVAEGEGYTVEGGSATKAGSYTATASLTDPANTEWADGTVADKQIPWSIGKTEGAIAIETAQTKAATDLAEAQRLQAAAETAQLEAAQAQAKAEATGSVADAAAAKQKAEVFKAAAAAAQAAAARAAQSAQAFNDAVEQHKNDLTPDEQEAANQAVATAASDAGKAVQAADNAVAEAGQAVAKAEEAQAKAEAAEAAVKTKTIAVPAPASGLVYNGKAQTGVAAGAGYTVTGNTATNAGSYTAAVTASKGYVFAGGKTAATVKWSIAKASGAIAFKSAKKTLTIKAGKSLKAAKAFKVTKNVSGGKVTYQLVKVPKAAKKYIKVAKSGKITVKKGIKKGKTYKIKVKAASAATANYSAATSKVVTIKVKVQ